MWYRRKVTVEATTKTNILKGLKELSCKKQKMATNMSLTTVTKISILAETLNKLEILESILTLKGPLQATSYFPCIKAA
jgi:hypothetical protein